ncbi:hypothetical protein DFH06DRAFT_1233568 [Mycena polygramma]|nr:hypothetical protein DFH06DRAFT_1233568 [Mycena polygramma]
MIPGTLCTALSTHLLTLAPRNLALPRSLPRRIYIFLDISNQNDQRSTSKYPTFKLRRPIHYKSDRVLQHFNRQSLTVGSHQGCTSL